MGRPSSVPNKKLPCWTPLLNRLPWTIITPGCSMTDTFSCVLALNMNFSANPLLGLLRFSYYSQHHNELTSLWLRSDQEALRRVSISFTAHSSDYFISRGKKPAPLTIALAQCNRIFFLIRKFCWAKSITSLTLVQTCRFTPTMIRMTPARFD